MSEQVDNRFKMSEPIPPAVRPSREVTTHVATLPLRDSHAALRLWKRL